MKKLIYFSLLFIGVCNYSNAQFNVMDSATLINVYQYSVNYNLANTPAIAPPGPDYSNLTTKKHPKWFRWTVCGSDQTNYTLESKVFQSSSNPFSSVAIWGPFADTIGISNKLNAIHLNQYYNFSHIHINYKLF